jgi:hypothetical protein
MKQKITITGVNVHDLLYESFLMRMAFDATVMRFAVRREMENGHQVVILLLEDDAEEIEYFGHLLESRDYNMDAEQIEYFDYLMEKTGSKVQIAKIEYEPFEGHVPELALAMTIHNCKLMDAFCPKT